MCVCVCEREKVDMLVVGRFFGVENANSSMLNTSKYWIWPKLNENIPQHN